MKIEKQINQIIKNIKINHIIVFIVINLLCFFLSFNFYNKTKNDYSYELTLKIQIPKYSRLDIGEFIKVVSSEKIFYELNQLNKNINYFKKCKINPNQHDKYFYFFSEEKYMSQLDKMVPIVIKIKYPDQIVSKTCANTIVEILDKIYEAEKIKLFNNLNEKLKIIEMNRKNKEKDYLENLSKIKKILLDTEVPIEIKVYLVGDFFENISDISKPTNNRDLEFEIKNNEDLKLSSEIFMEKVFLNNYILHKVVLINLFISSLLIIFYVFSLRKKI